MNANFYFIFIFVIASNYYSNAQNQLSINGLEANNQGMIAWDVDSIGVEPVKIGHNIPSPYNAFNNFVAYYYLSSREYIDTASDHGIQITGNVNGFDSLATTLSIYGKAFSDLSLNFEYITLGGDVQNVDWNFVGPIETRYYEKAGAKYSFYLNNEMLIKGITPSLKIVIDYNSEYTPFDDEISGITQYSMPVNATDQSSSTAAKDIATAFIYDINNMGIRLNFTSIQPAGQYEYNDSSRFGAFFEINSGLIETGTVSIPYLGDTISFCDGDSIALSVDNLNVVKIRF